MAELLSGGRALSFCFCHIINLSNDDKKNYE
jgi:hypothetical protein